MNKQKIVLLSIFSVFLIFMFSLIFVIAKKPKHAEQIYVLQDTIVKKYCFHPKTFPAPYTIVDGLPHIPSY